MCFVGFDLGRLVAYQGGSLPEEGPTRGVAPQLSLVLVCLVLICFHVLFFLVIINLVFPCTLCVWALTPFPTFP